MAGLTWASHPNGALRLRLADYIARGWTVETIDATSAVVSRRKAWTGPARLVFNGFYLLYAGRRDRTERIRLMVAASGEVIETRL